MSADGFMISMLVAAWAMIGGAFMNAAITAPENMRRVLISLQSHVTESVAAALTLLILGLTVPMWLAEDRLAAMRGFIGYMIPCYLAAWLIYSACWRIVRAVLHDSEDSISDKKAGSENSNPRNHE